MCAERTKKLNSAALRSAFSGCADFVIRAVLPGLAPGREAYVCWLDGLVDGAAVTEDVLRPLTERGRTPFPRSAERIMELMERGAVYSYAVKRRSSLEEACADLVNGCCAVVFDGPMAALTFETRSQTGRGVSEPTVEKSIKGAKDPFVETLRVNTAPVRRKLRSPSLKLAELTLGRESNTAVAVLYVEGVAKDATVQELLRRLRSIDTDGLLSAAEIEEALADSPKTPFPQLLHTERSDAFAMQLLNGRVGVIADGLPLGFLAPGCLPAFMRVPEDSASHFAVSSMLLALRWVALALSLLLPGAFVAVSMYHQEMLPTELLMSMSAAKQYVPFSSAAEVIAMLVSFELLQEAGLRLPDPVGQTASIIGALIVGQSAVEARIVSPIAVIIVALSGIAGYTLPSHDLSSAIRLLRFLFVIAGAALGLYGLMTALALLIYHLSALESFGAPYLTPLTDADGRGALRALLSRPVRANRRRSGVIAGGNLRRRGEGGK